MELFHGVEGKIRSCINGHAGGILPKCVTTIGTHAGADITFVKSQIDSAHLHHLTRISSECFLSLLKCTIKDYDVSSKPTRGWVSSYLY